MNTNYARIHNVRQKCIIYAKQNTTYTKTKYANQNTKYAKQNTKYAKQNSKYTKCEFAFQNTDYVVLSREIFGANLRTFLAYLLQA